MPDLNKPHLSYWGWIIYNIEMTDIMDEPNAFLINNYYLKPIVDFNFYLQMCFDN